MKKLKLLFGYLAFVLCLWLVAVTTYAAQLKRDGNGLRATEMQNAPVTCSSSSSSGSGS